MREFLSTYMGVRDGCCVFEIFSTIMSVDPLSFGEPSNMQSPLNQNSILFLGKHFLSTCRLNVSLLLSSLFFDRLEDPQWKLDPLIPRNLPYILCILICLLYLKYMDCVYMFPFFVNGMHRLCQSNVLYIIVTICPTTKIRKAKESKSASLECLVFGKTCHLPMKTCLQKSL